MPILRPSAPARGVRDGAVRGGRGRGGRGRVSRRSAVGGARAEPGGQVARAGWPDLPERWARDVTPP